MKPDTTDTTTPPENSIPTAAEIERMEDDLESYLNSPLAFADYRLVIENIEQPEEIPAVSLRRIAGAAWIRTLLPPRREIKRLKECLINDFFPAVVTAMTEGFSMLSEWDLNRAIEIAELREAAGLPPRLFGEGAKPQRPMPTPEAITKAVREGLEPLFDGLGRTIEKEGRRGALATLQATGQASPQQLADAARLWAETVKGTDHGSAK